MSDPSTPNTPEYPQAWGGPAVTGRVKAQPEDFVVTELCDHEPAGEGEHLWILLRKRENNTEWAAQQLAKAAKIKPRAVSYAGKKDRNAVTEQWISLNIPKRTQPDFSSLPEGLEVLRAEWHSRKLRRGALSGNRFEIVVRDIDGDTDALEARLIALRDQGCPNYFGSQRFGRNGANLTRAARHADEQSRKRPNEMWLSAVRSFLFNKALAARVKLGNWNQAVPGDCMVLAGSRSHFVTETVDAEIERRIKEFDIHPSGPMWGRGDVPVTGEALAIEQKEMRTETRWRNWLEQSGLQQDRRPLRMQVKDLTWELSGTDLKLAFALPAGSYATVVLDEIVKAAPEEAAQ